METKLYKVFEEVEVKAQLLSKYWHNFSTEISEHLPDSYQPELDELTNNLENAIATLVDELRNPTLTLATTGTTSSGKSTLVNLLCGAEIVPVAVSEMSAGAVTIEYSEQKSLIIHETPGALWECGEWTGITEEGIYQKLYDVMINYIDNREEKPNLACPRSTIYYPFRLLKESKLELPRGVKVKVMDLPGLAYVGDEGNKNVIKQCREALCLVTYNSAETDKEKVRSLLQEVVEQVKDLGGSPARMLFILNKIDVFRADRNYPDTEHRFVEATIKSIKNELTESLKEYTEDIEKLQVIKLSTAPALLALQIKNGDEIYSTDACKKANNHFHGLIDENILEDLPWKVEKWSRHDRDRVADSLWEKAYAEEFQEHLREHISQHFPRLVIPQAIERFNVAAGNAITEWALQTTNAILNSSEEKYQKECERILEIRITLKDFLESSNNQLREPFDNLKERISHESAENSLNILNEVLSQLGQTDTFNQIKYKLFPFYDWDNQIAKGINIILEEVAYSLKNGKVCLESPQIKKANYNQVNLLGRCLKRLISLGYREKSGKSIEARTDEKKDNLKKLTEEICELSTHLNLVIQDVIEKIATQQKERIYTATEDIFKFQISHLKEGANRISPNMNITLNEPELYQVERNLAFNINFESNIKITSGTWQEAVKVEKTKYILFIFKKTYYDTKYETGTSDNAEIPSVDTLLDNWRQQSKQSRYEMVPQITQWMLEQIDDLKKKVDDFQDNVMNHYLERLEMAHREMTLDFEKNKNIWQPIHYKAKDLSEEFSSLNKSLKTST